MSVARWLVRSVVVLSTAMVSVVPAATAEAGSAEAAAPSEADVMERFTDLGKSSTEERLASFHADKSLAGSLKKVSDLLARSGVAAADVEGALLPLIKGRTPEDAEVSLAAVMLEHYRGHLAQDAGAIEAMIQRDTVLTKAAFGAKARSRKMTRR
jgi:hypothetical protein